MIDDDFEGVEILKGAGFTKLKALSRYLDREIEHNLKKVTVARNSSEILMSYFCR
jgi:hypothetical protein